MGNHRSVLVPLVLTLLFIAHVTEAFAFQQDIEGMNRFLAIIVLIIMTIIVVIMFRTSEWFEDKWYFASSYQRAVSLGIGVPLWIAIFSFLIGGGGNSIGVIMVFVVIGVIVFHVKRWNKRRRIDRSYVGKSESYNDRRYGSESSSKGSYYDPHERTRYEESSDYDETYDRAEESRRYSEEEDYEEPEEESGEQYQEREEPRSQTDMFLKKCYETLEVAESASPDEIKKAYKKLVKQWHPDSHKSKERKEIAEREMKKINEAYDTLEKAGKVK